ncbi:unnamed protein product [Zymoseptoria tritici ST99CH_1A5]|uniref:Queuosine 5'-phosphate N-glycosylase/hydrolase n=2 Tax=Zymoseptoria tritici TaxID=1047171 RepID=A0A2H1GY30_ZYMTR|nr:unnamed protein product [Zymoseptoria tritici ST99CH_1E4]SMY27685.1 unnamed protein product [Zymoseptoria tritici ST99CH_1A5]
MSNDEVDPELLELLRQRLGISKPSNEIPRETGVLRDADFIYSNSIDVLIDMHGTKAAAAAIYSNMRERNYSPAAWRQHELHPRAEEGFSELDIVNFVFTMDILNFSFWSDLGAEERYQVEYRGKRWTGYNSLVACLRRALDEGIPITTPKFWRSRRCTNDVLGQVFRSATAEQISLLDERIRLLRDTSEVLRERFSEAEDEVDSDNDLPDENEAAMQTTEQPLQDIDAANQSAIEERMDASKDSEPTIEAASSAASDALPSDVGSDHLQPQSERGVSTIEPAKDTSELNPPPSDVSHTQSQTVTPDSSVLRIIELASHSSGRLVNLLAHHFPSAFSDTARFDGRRVRLLKRAQIFVADLWAALESKGAGRFEDIGDVSTGLTMFADYRVPQILCNLGVLSYSPPLNYRIRDGKPIESGHSWEVQLRGCSIWAVELIRREILRLHPEVNEEVEINAVLIDFFLYDLAKEREDSADMPHHRTRSIWY